MEPALAEKWEHPDPLTYVFTLRKGVKFHNVPPVNGREVTVDDAVYSLETLRNSVQVKQRLQDVAKIEKIDDTRFKVTLKYPLALFLEKLGQGNSPSVVWPKEAEALPGGLKDNSIGTGAFILKEWKSKEGWKVDRNPNWWDVDQYGNRLPYLDGIDYYLITDRAAYEAAFRTGKSDIWVPSRAEQVENMQKTNPDIVVSRIPPATPYSAVTLNFRLDKAPYNDDRVRRAMSMAVDRELVINTAFKGDAYFGPMTSWLYGGGGQWPAPAERLGPYYKYNPEAAKKLMAEAGYSAGFKMPVAITSASMSAEAGDTLLIVQDQLRKNLNVEIEFQVMEAAAFTAKRDKGDWDGAILLSVRGRGTGGWDWDDWVYYEWRSGSPNVVDSLKDEVLDKKLDDCRATEEKSAQEKCRADIWNHLHDKIYRLSFVSYPRYEVTQPWVENWGNYTYSWGISAGQHQIVAVWLTEKAPADRRK
ncbi:MAG TPA: ABC transporter substrate-binding protein [Dehalococcoidia bacterium]|nr:ABC transporter substrate-binding protein [Dehalococcoidia bacterium]